MAGITNDVPPSLPHLNDGCAGRHSVAGPASTLLTLTYTGPGDTNV